MKVGTLSTRIAENNKDLESFNGLMPTRQSHDQHGARTAALSGNLNLLRASKKYRTGGKTSSMQGWTELADSMNPVVSMFIQHPHVVIASRHL